nr:hypothetical protein [Candidatus Sigynarchaeum springense]
MTRAKVCAGVLAVIALVLASQAASAAPIQWYPQAGTTIEYHLSWNLSFKNGVRYTGSVFNVYNYTTENVIYLLAQSSEDSIFVLNGAANYVRLAAGVSVTLKHVYSETSMTTLGRHAIVVAGGLTMDSGNIRVFVFKNATWNVLAGINTTNDSLLKSNFITTPNRFVDHVDCTKNPGDSFTDAIQPAASTSAFRLTAIIDGKSPERISASGFYNSSTVIYRGSYIMDASGQVTSHTYTFSGITLLTNIAGASCTFSRQEAPSTLLPEWAYWIISGGLAVLAIGMAALAVKRGRKH